MKFLKLIALGAVICGVVYLISLLGNLSSDSNTDIEKPTIPGVLNPFYDRYKKDWEAQEGWNLALYKAHIDSANTYRTRLKINNTEHTELISNINKDVLDKLVNILEKQFRANPMPETEVKNNLNGINEVGKALTDNQQVAKMKKVWGTYVGTKSFVDKTYNTGDFPLGMSPDCSSWIPFSNHKDRECKRRDDFQHAPLFEEYFSGNSYLINGLNHVETKVENCRYGYYKRIADNIVSAYQHVPKFDASTYTRRIKNAVTENEYDQIKREYDDAWKSYSNRFDEKRRKIMAISGRFKKEITDKSLNDMISVVTGQYIEKPSKPTL